MLVEQIVARGASSSTELFFSPETGPDLWDEIDKGLKGQPSLMPLTDWS